MKLPTFISKLIKPDPQKTESIMRQPRIGLALGCGGAKALVHMGVLKVLEDHDIPIHAVAGCSMGAYVGALWASGISADQMIHLAAEMGDKDSFKKLADPAVPPIKGLFYGHKIKDHLEKTIGKPKIEELDRKFIAIAANLENYQRVVFNSGDLLEAVHASCAMPGIIVPVEVNGVRCVDGGVVDPVPVNALKKYTDVDYIIAICTTPTLDDLDSDEAVEAVVLEGEQDDTETASAWFRSKISSLGKKYNPVAKGNMLDTLRRSLKASQIRIAHDACEKAEVAIYPICKDSAWDEYERYEHFISLGAKETLAALEQIKNLTKPIPDQSFAREQEAKSVEPQA
ncbi:MAG: patatin-like phospholipase family protein [Akkermansiaceae bacterium]